MPHHAASLPQKPEELQQGAEEGQEPMPAPQAPGGVVFSVRALETRSASAPEAKPARAGAAAGCDQLAQRGWAGRRCGGSPTCSTRVTHLLQQAAAHHHQAALAGS